MKTAKAKKKPKAASSERVPLSLYPLDITTALGAALQTGKPPKMAQKSRPKMTVKGGHKS
jgi:hypothetical protein